MSTFADRTLLEYVQSVIRTGATEIQIPSRMLSGAGRGAIEDVRQLCAINGVEIQVIPG